jgi:hypothetical protein
VDLPTVPNAEVDPLPSLDCPENLTLQFPYQYLVVSRIGVFYPVDKNGITSSAKQICHEYTSNTSSTANPMI